MHGPTIPLVPIMPVSGANRCMLPPRPWEQPVARPKSSANSCARRHALGQGMPVPAMRAEDDVVAAQVRTDAGGDRLLPDVGMAGSVNQPALVRSCQLLFAAANQDHRAIKGQKLVAGSDGWRDRPRGGSVSSSLGSTYRPISDTKSSDKF